MKIILSYIITNLGRLIAAFVIFIVSLIFWSCAPKTEYYPVYKDVYIPVKCDVITPMRPTDSGNVLDNNLLVLRYLESLEIALNTCTGGAL